MKVCKKCNTSKDLDFFYTDKYSKDGYRNTCKECDKKYREENKDKLSIKRREWEVNNKVKRKEYLVKYREENKDVLSEKSKKYREENKEMLLENNKIYRDKNRDNINSRERERYSNLDIVTKKEKYKIKNDKSKDRRKKYYELNKEVILENMKNNYELNKDRKKEYKKLYNKRRNELRNKRRKTDQLFILSETIRKYIKNSLKKYEFSKNNRKTIDILGCSIIEFRDYLQSKFDTWMTWENRGLYNGNFNYGWDIDHIIPLSSAHTEDDIIKLNHYTNLQPLCSKINRDIKKGKLDYPNINPGER